MPSTCLNYSPYASRASLDYDNFYGVLINKEPFWPVPVITYRPNSNNATIMSELTCTAARAVPVNGHSSEDDGNEI